METWHEPGRDLPVAGRPDVLVVGAGAAGVAAALAAARRGASTWLVERLGFVGGLATGGLINLLLTLDDGEGNQVVAGICQEFVDRIDARGEARFPPTDEWGSEDLTLVDGWRRWGLIWGAPEAVRYSVAYDPEAFVDVSYEQLSDAGVRLRLHTAVTAAYLDGDRIDAVVTESKSGREVLLPGVVIDTTGDADVAVSAGVAHERVEVWPYLWFRMGGVEGLESGATHGGFYFRTTGDGRVLVPWGGPGLAARKVDPVDPDDLTRAELDCRARARAEADRLRRDVAGFERAWIDDYARMLGITESRRVIGDYVLQKDDGGRSFPDAVARTGHWTVRGVVYEVPYRCLTTPTASNLLVAGRCISASRYVHQATKEIPAAMATGEAAGAAAARAMEHACRVREVDVVDLRRDLVAGGADLGPGQPGS